jgi:hypothetical protein
MVNLIVPETKDAAPITAPGSLPIFGDSTGGRTPARQLGMTFATKRVSAETEGAFLVTRWQPWRLTLEVREVSDWVRPNDCSTGGAMNRPHVLDSSEEELAILNAKLDASVLDEDTWEDATDETGIDREMLCHSQWRSSTLDSVD